MKKAFVIVAILAAGVAILQACNKLEPRARSNDALLDGPVDGLSNEQIEKLGQRGVRLDERSVGHGMGIAIAFEILRLNRGSMELGRSSMGGLSVRLGFVAKGRALQRGVTSPQAGT